MRRDRADAALLSPPRPSAKSRVWTIEAATSPVIQIWKQRAFCRPKYHNEDQVQIPPLRSHRNRSMVAVEEKKAIPRKSVSGELKGRSIRERRVEIDSPRINHPAVFSRVDD